ncbi:hypothetical protein Tco_0481546 [Tanacetum coccineum]
MKDVFNSSERDLSETWKQNNILKDQLLEATLKHEIKCCVLLSHECVDNNMQDEIEKVQRDFIEIQEGMQKRLSATSNVRRSSNRDSSFKDNLVSNTKNSAEKVEVSNRTNKKPDVASKNITLNTLVTNDEIKNARIAKNVLCVTCAKNVVQIVLWIVDSGCSKHMTGDRSLLKNFVEKFMGTVRFGNNHLAAITGYGDYVQGNIMICHVYYVEGLGHNLFSVRKFCDIDLEVPFLLKTCYMRNLEGDYMLIGYRKSNLYTISIPDMVASYPVCLMSKAFSTKSWLCPQLSTS